MLVLQHSPITCTHRHGSEIRLRVGNSAPERTPKASWNRDRTAWRAAYRDMRKFRNVAIAWIYRMAKLDTRLVYNIPSIALALFEELLTEQSIWVNGVAHYHGEHDREMLASGWRFDVGARVMPSWWSANYPHRAKWWRLVSPAKKDREQDCAWGCGQRAIIALADRFADLRRRHHHVVGDRLEHLTAHLIGDELLDMWRRAEEAQKETK